MNRENTKNKIKPHLQKSSFSSSIWVTVILLLFILPLDISFFLENQSYFQSNIPLSTSLPISSDIDPNLDLIPINCNLNDNRIMDQFIAEYDSNSNHLFDDLEENWCSSTSSLLMIKNLLVCFPSSFQIQIFNFLVLDTHFLFSSILLQQNLTAVEDYNYLNLWLTQKQTNFLNQYLTTLIVDEYYYIKENKQAQSEMLGTLNQLQMNTPMFQSFGLEGDSSMRLALMDRGIDTTHPSLAGKDVLWMDFTGHASSAPEDFVGHGTEIASIAAGQRFNATDGQNRSRITNAQYIDFGGDGWTYNTEYIYYLGAVNVTSLGVLSFTAIWDRPEDSMIDITKITILNQTGSYMNNESVAENTNKTVSYIIDSESKLGIYRFGYIFEVSGGKSSTQHSIVGEILAPMMQSNQSAVVSGSVMESSEYRGIAPNVGLAMLRVEWENEIISAMNWLLLNAQGYNITALSISLTIPSEAVYTLANLLVEAGVVVICAAGNYGFGGNYAGDLESAPASAEKVITVGAVGRNNSVTSYSSEGGQNPSGITTKPDIVAPGGERTDRYDINTPLITADCNTNEFFAEYPTAINEPLSIEGVADRVPNDLTFVIGTSYAAPIVAGVVMLMQQQLGGLNCWNYSKDAVMEIKNILLATASESAPAARIGAPEAYWPTLDRGGKDVHEGYGRINPLAALEALKTSSNPFNITNQKLYCLNSTMDNLAFNYYYPSIYTQRLSMETRYSYDFEIQTSNNLDVDLFFYSLENLTNDPYIIANATSISQISESLRNFSLQSNGDILFCIKTVVGAGEYNLTITKNLDTIAPHSASLVSSIDGNFYSDNIEIFLNVDERETKLQNISVFISPSSLSEITPIGANSYDLLETRPYASEFLLSLNDLQDGWYSLIFEIADGNNNKINTSAVIIGVDNTAPDSILFISPESKDTVQGLITFEIQCSDQFSGISKIILKDLDSDTNWIVYLTQNSGLINYQTFLRFNESLSLASNQSIDGNYLFYFEVFDLTNNSRSSSPVLIYINNARFSRDLISLIFSILVVTLPLGNYIAKKILIKVDFIELEAKIKKFPLDLRKRILKTNRIKG